MSVALFHKDGSPVVLDLTEIIAIQCQPIIKNYKLTVGTINFSLTRVTTPKYICTGCNKIVPVDELLSPCSNCGKMHSIENLNVCSDVGSKLSGFYCQKCTGELKLNVVRKLPTILKNFSVED